MVYLSEERKNRLKEIKEMYGSIDKFFVDFFIKNKQYVINTESISLKIDFEYFIESELKPYPPLSADLKKFTISLNYV